MTQVINSRDVDPFGLPQDLSEKKVVGPSVVNEGTELPLQPAAVQLEINKLQGKVTVLGNSFALESSNYRVGDTLKVHTGGETFLLEVLTVKKQVVIFRDRKNQKRIPLMINGGIKRLEPGGKPQMNGPDPLFDLDK